MSLTDALIDFSMLSVILIVSYWLKRKIKVLQTNFIPANLIAGSIAMFLGKGFLGKISPVCLTFSDSFTQ